MTRVTRFGILAAIVAATLGMVFTSATGRAQEEQQPVVRIEVDALQPIPAGEEFEARVVVDDVQGLAAFDFELAFDPERVRYREMRDVGLILSESDRTNVRCNDPELLEDSVTVSCVTLGPPVCLGGPAGASGSGVLARVVFTARGGGDTTLSLRNSTLVLDDLQPCDPETSPTRIPHDREDLTIRLEGGEGGIPWLIIGPVAAVVVLGVLGAGAGLLWYRRSQSSA